MPWSNNSRIRSAQATASSTAAADSPNLALVHTAVSWLRPGENGWDHAGLFAKVEDTGAIHGPGLIEAVAAGDKYVGALAGDNHGTIESSYADDWVYVYGEEEVGGLVGRNGRGTVEHSHAGGIVLGEDAVGGLIGRNREGAIVDSHSSSTVTGHVSVGGLAGENGGVILRSHATGNVFGIDGVSERHGEASIITSYSIGTVSGEEAVGGLVGLSEAEIEDRFYNSIPVKSIKASYWNVETSGQMAGVGEGPTSGAVGKTTAELQAPTGNTGIYQVWNTDVDNNDFDADTTGREDFWIFGDATQYPALKSLRHGDSSTNELWSFISLLLERHADAPARTDRPTSTNTSGMDLVLGSIAQPVEPAGAAAQTSSQGAFVPQLSGAARKPLPDLTPLAAAANAGLLLAPLGIIRFMRGRRIS